MRDWQRNQQNLTRSAAARYSSNIARFFQRPQNQAQPTNEEGSADDNEAETAAPDAAGNDATDRNDAPVEMPETAPDPAPDDVETNVLDDNDENVSASAFPSFTYIN